MPSAIDILKVLSVRHSGFVHATHSTSKGDDGMMRETASGGKGKEEANRTRGAGRGVGYAMRASGGFSWIFREERGGGVAEARRASWISSRAKSRSRNEGVCCKRV